MGKNPIAVAVLLLLVAANPVAAQVTVAIGVPEAATEANSQPKMARDRSGAIYLTFVKPVGGTDQVFLASSSNDGATWRVQPVTTGPTPSRFPALAIGPDNAVYLAWTQYDGGIGKVYYARFDGQRWTPPQKISPGDAYAGIPALVVDPKGQVDVVWYGIRNQAPTVQTRHGSLYEILYTTLAGGRWSEPILISPGIPDSINPALALDSRGRLHSAWYQFDLRSYQVRHSELDRTWTQPEQISRGEDASSVAMAVGRDDAIYLVWERHESAGTRIFFATRDQRWSEQQALSTAGKAADDPSIAVDARGRVYVAWASEGQIHLTRRNRTGQWLGVDLVTAEGRNDHPILASSGDNVDLLWTQQVGEERRVVFATLAGRTGPPQSAGPPPLWGVLILALIVIMALWQWRRIQAAGRGG